MTTIRFRVHADILRDLSVDTNLTGDDKHDVSILSLEALSAGQFKPSCPMRLILRVIETPTPGESRQRRSRKLCWTSSGGYSLAGSEKMNGTKKLLDQDLAGKYPIGGEGKRRSNHVAGRCCGSNTVNPPTCMQAHGTDVKCGPIYAT